MKTVILSILIVCSFSLIQAQKPTNLKNLTYLSDVATDKFSQKVSKMQQLISQYNVNGIDGFNGKSSSTYDVVIEESNSKIMATFNKEGEIIKSYETYNNIRIPTKLAVNIAKKYPEWKFTGANYSVDYESDNATKKVFTVEMKNNGVVKTLKFSYFNKPENVYVALH